MQLESWVSGSSSPAQSAVHWAGEVPRALLTLFRHDVAARVLLKQHLRINLTHAHIICIQQQF